MGCKPYGASGEWRMGGKTHGTPGYWLGICSTKNGGGIFVDRATTAATRQTLGLCSGAGEAQRSGWMGLCTCRRSELRMGPGSEMGNCTAAQTRSSTLLAAAAGAPANYRFSQGSK